MVNKKIFIYVLINPLNDKIFYVGFTNNLKKRFNSHLNIYGKSKEKNSYKNNVIKKILITGHKPEMKIIDECNYIFNKIENIYEHERLEKFYIKKYKDSGIKLTNLTEGGEGGAHNKKRVYQYDINGKFIKQYSTIKEIADEYNAIISTPSHALNQKNRKFFKGTYLFTSHKKAKEFNFNKIYKIFQYSLKGSFISKYKSIKEASIENNISEVNISNCLSGKNKQSGGYYWYRSDNIPEIIKQYEGRYSKIIKPIFQYDLNHNLINEFESIISAARFLNIKACNIVMNLKGNTKKCNNSIFEYKNNYN